MQAPDVVEAAVVAFRDDTVDGSGIDTDVRVLLHHVFDHGGEGRACAEGVGQDDGGLDGPQLLYLHEPRTFPKSVYDRYAGHDLFLEKVPAMRQDGGHAGVDLAFLNGDLPHFYAGNVCDEVPPSGLPFKLDVQAAVARQSHVCAPFRAFLAAGRLSRYACRSFFSFASKIK